MLPISISWKNQQPIRRMHANRVHVNRILNDTIFPNAIFQTYFYLAEKFNCYHLLFAQEKKTAVSIYISNTPYRFAGNLQFK